MRERVSGIQIQSGSPGLHLLSLLVSDRPLRGREGSASFHQVSHLLLDTQAVEAARLSFWEQWRKGESRRLGDRKAGLNPSICCCVTYECLIFPSLAWAWWDGGDEPPAIQWRENKRQSNTEKKAKRVPGSLTLSHLPPRPVRWHSPEQRGSQLRSLMSAEEAKSSHEFLHFSSAGNSWRQQAYKYPKGRCTWDSVSGTGMEAGWGQGVGHTGSCLCLSSYHS